VSYTTVQRYETAHPEASGHRNRSCRLSLGPITYSLIAPASAVDGISMSVALLPPQPIIRKITVQQASKYFQNLIAIASL
jgi:hypothetical protein